MWLSWFGYGITTPEGPVSGVFSPTSTSWAPAATKRSTRSCASCMSMFATETNSDVARAAWLPKGAEAWSEAPIMDFRKAEVTEFWAGRRVPSRHNTSAPDMDFSLFSDKAAR